MFVADKLILHYALLLYYFDWAGFIPNEPNRKVKEYSIDGWLQKVPFNQSLHILRKYQNVHTLHWPSKIILSLMVWRILWKVECLQELTLNQSQRFFKALHFFLN